jgi:hypothetical protein
MIINRFVFNKCLSSSLKKLLLRESQNFFPKILKRNGLISFGEIFLEKNSLREYFRVRVRNYFTESFNALPAANFTRLDALIWISLPV